MTTHNPSAVAGTEVPSVFDAAKSISEILAGMQKPEQARVLRWVGESLGIHLVPAAEIAAPAVPSALVPPGAAAAVPSPSDRPQDIKSFVADKQPKSDNQYVAVVAYFYRFQAREGERQETINAKLLEDSTRLADWRRLAKPNVTLNNAMLQGYLDRAGRGEYKINNVGENLVAMTLPGGDDNGAPPSRARGGRQKVAKKTRKKTAKKSGKARGE